ncbi:uncharacterized protein LOC135486024 [Lineus longissimus]|uniref:uncharacterized protein LOC135486024 n=1 Tax=Lineus longissimus TaxID=88925 RepID=UPI00315CD3EA
MALQECWLKGVGWDDSLPEDIHRGLKEWAMELSQAENVKIPRCYRSRPIQDVEEMTLHTFSDAFHQAYGAVAYLRYQYTDGAIEVGMVASKFKVTPLHNVSILRLELMAAVIAARLAEVVSRNVTCPMSKFKFWTDSTDVVHWVRAQSRHYKAFVTNRVAVLHEKTQPSQWDHVPGTLNPADLGTRGMRLKEMVPDNVWFKGPKFLHEGEEAWPSACTSVVSSPTDEAAVETRTSAAVFQAQVTEALIDPQRYHSWLRLKRVTAWIFRFIKNLKSRLPKYADWGHPVACKPDNMIGTRQERQEPEPLIVKELAQASIYWLKQAQQERFAADIACLEGGKTATGRL